MSVFPSWGHTAANGYQQAVKGGRRGWREENILCPFSFQTLCHSQKLQAGFCGVYTIKQQPFWGDHQKTKGSDGETNTNTLKTQKNSNRADDVAKAELLGLNICHSEGPLSATHHSGMKDTATFWNGHYCYAPQILQILTEKARGM